MKSIKSIVLSILLGYLTNMVLSRIFYFVTGMDDDMSSLKLAGISPLYVIILSFAATYLSPTPKWLHALIALIVNELLSVLLIVFFAYNTPERLNRYLRPGLNPEDLDSISESFTNSINNINQMDIKDWLLFLGYFIAGYTFAIFLFRYSKLRNSND